MADMRETIRKMKAMRDDFTDIIETVDEWTREPVALPPSPPPPPDGLRIDTKDPAHFAIRLVGLWEGNTFGWHGSSGKTYGILGFEGDVLKELRRDANGAREPGPEAQIAFGRKYYDRVVALSCAPRGINSIMGRAFAFDMAINNGLYHDIFQEAEYSMGLADRRAYTKPFVPAAQIQTYLMKVAQKRIGMRNHLFAKYPGLRPRYEWWKANCAKSDEELFIRGAAAKGAIVTIATSTLQSPVSRSVSLWGGDWYSATNFGQVLPDVAQIPKAMRGKLHSGYDLNRPHDKDRLAPVYAIADGEVIYAADDIRNLGWGSLIVIDHGDVFSRYGHCVNDAKLGDTVKKGDRIGRVGDGGGLYPYHLHFDLMRTHNRGTHAFRSFLRTAEELRENFIDPMDYWRVP